MHVVPGLCGVRGRAGGPSRRAGTGGPARRRADDRVAGGPRPGRDGRPRTCPVALGSGSCSTSRSNGGRRADGRCRRGRHPRAGGGGRRGGRDHRHRPCLDTPQRAGARGRRRGRRDGARPAAPRRRRRTGTGRFRDTGPARGPVRPAPGVARRARRRPDRGPAGPARRRRARRERGGAGGAAVRRRLRGCDGGVHRTRHGHRRRPPARRRALPRGVRGGAGARPHPGRAGRPALRVREERLLGALLQRNRPGDHGRRAAGQATTSTPRCSRGSPRAIRDR